MQSKTDSKHYVIKKRRLAVIDLETDPFLHGRVPQAFAAGFFDGVLYKEFWGDDCVQQLLDFLIYDYPEPLIIYAHNGGKFDFFYFIRHLQNPIKVINGRIVKAALAHHEIRDSFAIIPEKLSSVGGKLEIDYDLFERENRENAKDDILHYLAVDCEELYKLVRPFLERFGDKLTIASAAITELKKLHPFQMTNKTHDEFFRKYYFGGRVSVFESGVINGDFKLYDVNSMYPHAMRNFKHPTGRGFVVASNPKISPAGDLIGYKPDQFYFIHVSGVNNGALPIRDKTGLRFDCKEGEFFTTSHELKVALKHGCFKIQKIHSVVVPYEQISFVEFVDKFSKEKQEAKKGTVEYTFAKLVLNSSYGKFATDPSNFREYEIVSDLSEMVEKHGEYFLETWTIEQHGDGFMLFSKPVESDTYYNVATAASITSASRSVLLDAIMSSKRVLYCDTDSLLCEEFGGDDIHPTRLGAWDCEKEGIYQCAIAGKKLYALFARELVKGEMKETVKTAAKGAVLSPKEILSIANGETIVKSKMSPTYNIKCDPTDREKLPTFITRSIKSTVKI